MRADIGVVGHHLRQNDSETFKKILESGSRQAFTAVMKPSKACFYPSTNRSRGAISRAKSAEAGRGRVEAGKEPLVGNHARLLRRACTFSDLAAPLSARARDRLQKCTFCPTLLSCVRMPGGAADKVGSFAKLPPW